MDPTGYQNWLKPYEMVVFNSDNLHDEESDPLLSHDQYHHVLHELERVDSSTAEWLAQATRLAKFCIDQWDVDAAEALADKCEGEVRDQLLTNIVVYLFEKNRVEKAFEVSKKIADQLMINERLNQLTANDPAPKENQATLAPPQDLLPPKPPAPPCQFPPPLSPSEDCDTSVEEIRPTDHEEFLKVIQTCIDSKNFEYADEIIGQILDPELREKAQKLLYLSFESQSVSKKRKRSNDESDSELIDSLNHGNKFLAMPKEMHDCIRIHLDEGTKKIYELVCRKLRKLYKCHTPPTRLCAAYAATGNLQMLQWARLVLHAKWDTSTCAEAARGGHLDVLKWAHENGAPSDVRTWEEAARGGHQHVLDWALANGATMDIRTCIGAVEGGHLQLVQWSFKLKLHMSRDRHISNFDLLHSMIQAAARSGQLDTLIWLRNQWLQQVQRRATLKDPWKTICGHAASKGHLDILQWARKNGFHWDASTCAKAAGAGHLHILQWARANGAPWDERTCAQAARYGHLQALHWARANGAPWDESTCQSAAHAGQLGTLSWAHAYKAPINEKTFVGAALAGHHHILIWADENGIPWIHDEICAEAAKGGHLSILQWARAKGAPWDKKICAEAAEWGFLHILQWARANGAPWDAAVCLDIAARHQRHEIVEWILAEITPAQKG